MKPMLAATLKDINDLEPTMFPMICSPKVDGIRCLTTEPIIEGKRCNVVSRALKPINNDHIYQSLSTLPPGFDGELITHDENGKTHEFFDVSSRVMRGFGKPRFTYWVFDYVTGWFDKTWYKGISTGYAGRLIGLRNAVQEANNPHVKMLEQKVLHNHKEVEEYLEQNIAAGYEGICLRVAWGPYKFGRSTNKEGWLFKVKSFEDAEAKIVGFEEQLHNSNDFKSGEKIGLRRHTYKEGMVPCGVLGAFIVEDLKTKVQFSIGSGLNDSMREEIWKNRDTYLGRLIKYKHQPYGRKELPRTPIFLGFRDDLL